MHTESDGAITVARTGIVIEDFIAVDCFLNNPKMQYRFISSAHYRFFRLSASHWESNGIYCSPVTARLLPIIVKQFTGYEITNQSCIHPLELNVWHKMDGFSVILLDANHAPGSVMLLFEGERISSGRILYTGYFKPDTSFYCNRTALSVLQEKKIDIICIDSTYFDCAIKEFPSRKSAAVMAANVIRNISNCSFDSVAIPVPLIGREKFLVDIAEQLKCKIWLHPQIYKIAIILGINRYFTSAKEDTYIWTCSQKDMEQIISSTNSHILIASMMTQNEVSSSKEHVIAYSDHCSPAELCSFLSQLSFVRIYGAPNKFPSSIRAELEELSLPETVNSQRSNLSEMENVQESIGDDSIEENFENLVQLINSPDSNWSGLAYEYAYLKFCNLLETEAVMDSSNLFIGISNENLPDLGEISSNIFMTHKSTGEEQMEIDDKLLFDKTNTMEQSESTSFSFRKLFKKFFDGILGEKENDATSIDDGTVDESSLNDVYSENDDKCLKSCSENSDENFGLKNNSPNVKIENQILVKLLDNVPNMLDSLANIYYSANEETNGLTDDLQKFLDLGISKEFKDFDDFYDGYQAKNVEASSTDITSQPYNPEDHVQYDFSNAPKLPDVASEVLVEFLDKK